MNHKGLMETLLTIVQHLQIIQCILISGRLFLVSILFFKNVTCLQVIQSAMVMLVVIK